MPYGISLKCLNDTASPVFKLWDDAAAFEETASMRALNYPPHITLAVYQEIAVDRLAEAAERVFRIHPAVALSFAGTGYFENEFLVLWARPNQDERLFQLHAELHREIDPVHCHECYRPGNWCRIARSPPKSRRQNRRQRSTGQIATGCNSR
ncbi:2'-5' RNA ligase family protein [Rhizobium sp. CBN3]|uniref:2'-5' RNA ligase family protein n=1 Tax=Rhizobium sp. CBN3 TaxID=3058045 RepID=UPI002673EACF|nr:2'-5' RNA ligase family protein [Rhizobium sp. CBN3]MDO3435583.1 2'-5' RNA ligase family protein [Rhizobium sp. CBN3]